MLVTSSEIAQEKSLRVGSTPDDRRTTDRQSVSLPVRWRDPEGQLLFGTARNISRGGMFVQCSNRPAFGQSIEINFLMPGTTFQIRVAASVRWLSGTGFGVQFIDVGRREQHFLDSLMNVPSSI